MFRVLLGVILVLALTASSLAGDEPHPTKSEKRTGEVKVKPGDLRVLPLAEAGFETDYYRFRNLHAGTAGGIGSAEAAASALARLLRPSGNLTYIPKENAIIFRGREAHIQALKQILVVLDRRSAAPDAALGDTSEVQRYEEMLRDSKTEAAAQYFVERLSQLREKAAARVR